MVEQKISYEYYSTSRNIQHFRQRDKISVLLEEFSTVQEEADKIDNMLNTLALQAEGGSG